MWLFWIWTFGSLYVASHRQPRCRLRYERESWRSKASLGGVDKAEWHNTSLKFRPCGQFGTIYLWPNVCRPNVSECLSGMFVDMPKISTLWPVWNHLFMAKCVSTKCLGMFVGNVCRHAHNRPKVSKHAPNIHTDAGTHDDIEKKSNNKKKV